MPHGSRVSPVVMDSRDPESQHNRESTTDANIVATADEQQRSRRRKLRRILNKILVFFGFLLIIGCFVMASFAYIFLEDCRGCSDDAPELYMAKVFRFLSAALFLVGVFMVAFSVCNYHQGSTISRFGNSDNLRRISLETVACVITDAAMEKTPARLLSSDAMNSPRINSTNILSCTVTELTDSASDGPSSNQCRGSLAKQRRLFPRSGNCVIPGAIDEDVTNPPPSYEQALDMMNADTTDTHQDTQQPTST